MRRSDRGIRRPGRWSGWSVVGFLGWIQDDLGYDLGVFRFAGVKYLLGKGLDPEGKYAASHEGSSSDHPF